MNFSLIPYAVGWGLLAVAVIVLIIYRKRVSSGEDDTLHVMDGDVRLVPHQQAVARKLEAIDRWGKSLTVLAVLTGLAIALLWVYQTWTQASNYMAH